MTVETNTGAEPVTGTPVPPSTSVDGSEPAVSNSSVITTHEQTDAERKEAANKAWEGDLLKVWEKNNQPRALDGKFAPKDAAAAPATETPETPAPETAADKPTEPTDQAQQSKVEPAKPAIDPPLSWSADMKAKWAALPPEVQTYVSQRDKETHDAISRAGQNVKEHEQRIRGYEPFDQLITANKDNFARRGVSPTQAFAMLLDAQRQLDDNPVAGLVQIGLGYGIDLRPIFQGQGNQQPAVQADPRVAQLEAQLREMRDWRSAQESKVATQEKAANERQLTDVVKTINDFAKDKPYWADIQDDIMSEVKVLRDKHPDQSPSEILTKAYERATWANSDIRTRVQADQRKADEDKRKSEAEAKAKQARSAASVNVKSGSPGTATPKTVDDTLNEIAKRIYGRPAA